MSLYDLGARALRALDPETAHALSLRALNAGLGPGPAPADDPILAVSIAGLQLPNCVGLAAGYDKDAEVYAPMLRFGFGFVECGSVTPKPQAGSPRPRLFRLTPDRAVINRMGFNNDGLEAFAYCLSRRVAGQGGVVGANVGANKDSPDRIGDYVLGLQRLWSLADYFTLNVSSPNTPGLRALQTRDALQELLGRTDEARRSLTLGAGPRPVFLKVAPDLDEAEIEAIASASLAGGVDGLIISNTTVCRPDSLRSPHRGEGGGLSGAPLLDRSTEVLRRFAERTGDRLPLIGVGGVGSGADALAKIRAGACAVQLYSALVFEGPGLVARIKRDLAARLRAEGFSSVAEAVGR